MAYSEKLRGSLFTSFLTLGGFLFSLKTFIVIKMKENVYDHKSYKERIAAFKQINSSISTYGPLKRLSNLLFYTVIASLVSSFSQFTLGFINHWLAALVCVFIALFTLFLFIASLIEIKQNLNHWFDFLEQEQNK